MAIALKLTRGSFRFAPVGPGYSCNARQRVAKLPSVAFGVIFAIALSAALVGCDKSDGSGEEPATLSEQIAGEHPKYEGWCHGHDLPEALCTKCHPDLVDRYKEAGDWCEEHEFPESACPECNPMDPPGEESAGSPAPTDEDRDDQDQQDKPADDAVAVEGLESGTQIVLKQQDHEATVGIETESVREAPVGMGVQAPTRLEFDRNRYADVRAAVPGIVREVLVDMGDEVDEGDPLFVLESGQVGEVQAQVRAASQALETARSNLERQEKLQDKGLSAKRKVEEARRDFEAAESRLESLESTLRLAGGAGTTSTGRYTVRAPIAGSVAQRPAVVGGFANQETPLATVVDTSKMWAMLDVSEQEGFALERGQPVVLSVDGAKDRTFEGKVTWISPEVDARTRTIKVRAEIDNADGKLRAHQFARAEIEVAPAQAGVIVPKEAVQRFNDGVVIFVRTGEGKYEPRAVEIGRRDGDVVQVRGDLKPGESVVTTGAFVLKTELNKDGIGAGCCEVSEE
ncbi:MAG: efflux RND transporter periplasmic adaptor subunit [Persicimonas sp.]